ncbi:N-acetyltransferase [Amycolatopsis sp. A1MSW2902]|uniref:GNAT family N-acetyltransferase n=1 Tax=Amycolatopsis sp. A1MSW2902 TaxID=687413 RepID=UPI00307ED949
MSNATGRADAALAKPQLPRKLQRTDDVAGFQSGADELDTWLTKFAYTNQKSDSAVTYVTTTQDGRVVGYYAITVSGVSKQHVPNVVAGNSPPKDIPCILLARLAVDWEYQGKGIGRHLLKDAMERAVGLSESVGIRALLIHARDEDARNFYMAQAEFVESPSDPMHLMLSMKDISANLTARRHLSGS